MVGNNFDAVDAKGSPKFSIFRTYDDTSYQQFFAALPSVSLLYNGFKFNEFHNICRHRSSRPSINSDVEVKNVTLTF